MQLCLKITRIVLTFPGNSLEKKIIALCHRYAESETSVLGARDIMQQLEHLYTADLSLIFRNPLILRVLPEMIPKTWAKSKSSVPLDVLLSKTNEITTKNHKQYKMLMGLDLMITVFFLDSSQILLKLKIESLL